MVEIFLSLVILTLNQAINCYNVCKDNKSICPPYYLYTTKTNLFPIQYEGEYPSIDLGFNKESGCWCRKSMEFTLCFGREYCKSVPKINITTQLFQLKATNIVQLQKTSFPTNIKGLIFDYNDNLMKIQVGAFENLKNLENLSLSYNLNLKKLDKGAFKGLINLRELFLVKNGFEKILDISPAISQLPNLEKLELSDNHFSIISKADFQPLKNSTLQDLNLISCRIDYIESKSLKYLRNLTTLRIGENNINVTVITELINETVINNKVPLKYLNLYKFGFRKVPPMKLMKIIGQSTIETLSLSNNQFEELNSKSFPLMPNLKVLLLKEVSLLNVTKNTFKMPKLKTLVLSGNKLNSIPEGVLLLPQITYLDLQENNEQLLSNSFSIYGGKFKNMTNLEVLNLSFNKVLVLHNNSFVGLPHLRVLGLKNASIFYMDQKSFSMLKNLIFLNLENNPFGKVYTPSKELFQNLTKLQVLLLGGCNLKFINNTFEGLHNLRHLGLERNNLLTLSIEDFKHLSQLETIDFSDNQIKSYDLRVFTFNSKLQLINGAHNEICHFTEAMIRDFNNVTLNLMDNPFHCNCRLLWRNANDIIIKMKHPPLCAFPYNLANYTLKDFVQNNCDNYELFLALPIVIPLILVILLGIILIYYRYHVRYWIFLIRLNLSKKSTKRLNNNNNGKMDRYNYHYDAFVSYSNEDRNFVIRLVTMLENHPPYLKLCVYERDFEIGSIITESILESVAKSRRTLLIISNSYVKSQWCRWESQIAEHHRLFFENNDGQYTDDSLVLIKLGPINEIHLTPTLKYLLKTRIYLLWEADEKKQRFFWEKLRKALAPPKEIIENTHL